MSNVVKLAGRLATSASPIDVPLTFNVVSAGRWGNTVACVRDLHHDEFSFTRDRGRLATRASPTSSLWGTLKTVSAGR